MTTLMISLREFKDADAPLLVEYLNHPQVTHYITAAIPTPYTLDDAHWWIKHSKQSTLIKAITYQGQFIGCISATPGQFEYSHSAEIGYWLGNAYWQQGLATQALAMFVEKLQKDGELKRVFVSVVTDNNRSISVLKKNEFELEGTLKQASCKNGVFFDEHIYAKLI